MFGMLSRSNRSHKSIARRTTTLCLEGLEDRLSPASGAGAEILTVNVTYLPGKQATFSGELTNRDGPIANQAINIIGVVSGSATTNSQGDYSVTLSVPKLGMGDAVSADGKSNFAPYNLVGGSPTVSNFTAEAEGNNLWLISGTVSGAPTQGEVVNFGGIIPLQGQSTSVNSDGTFEFYAIIPAGEGGWAYAQAVDWWGDTSQKAVDYVGD
jgi:hypothetical protein